MSSSSDAPAFPIGRRERLRRTVRRVVLARRRPLAAVCAAVAVLAGLQAARPAPAPTVPVPVAARDLLSGTVLSPDDLVTRRFPADLAPPASSDDGVGRTLAAPVRAGEPVTDVRLVAPSLVSGYPGRVALPVRVADADSVALLRVGDRVSLVAADPRRGTASYLAVDVPVLALPRSDTGSADPASASPPGRLVVIGTLPGEVAQIAGAAATDLLSVVISD
jgi:Flp pilus assembly protein CpaB